MDKRVLLFAAVVIAMVAGVTAYITYLEPLPEDAPGSAVVAMGMQGTGESLETPASARASTADKWSVSRPESIPPSLVRPIESTGNTPNLFSVENLLDPHGAIEGVVLGSDGRPLHDFSVGWVKDIQADLRFLPEGFTQFTDDEGRFLLPHVIVGEATLIARAPDHCAIIRYVRGIQAGMTVSGIVLQLDAAASIDGVVLDRLGKPISGASIFRDWIPTQRRAESTDRLAVSGDDGRFYADSITPGEVKLYVVHPAYTTADIQLTLRKGVSPLEVRLTAGGTLAGKVTMDGNPVDGAFIHVQDHSGVNPINASSDPDGNYRIHNVREGSLTVHVYVLNADASRLAEVAAGKETIVDFPIQTNNATVEGNVTVNGEIPAMDQASLTLMFESELRNSFHIPVQPDGSFRMDGLPAGEAVITLYIRRSHFRRDYLVHTEANRVVRRDIDLNSGNRITGVVSGMEADENIIIIFYWGEVPIEEIDPDGMSAISHLLVGSVDAKPDGTFETSPMDPGHYTALVRTSTANETPENAHFALQYVEIKEGEDSEITIVLP